MQCAWWIVGFLVVPVVGAAQATVTPFEATVESGTTLCVLIPGAPSCPMQGQYGSYMLEFPGAPVRLDATMTWQQEAPTNRFVDVFLMWREAGTKEHLERDPGNEAHGESPLAFTMDLGAHAGHELWLVVHSMTFAGPVGLRVGETFDVAGSVLSEA